MGPSSLARTPLDPDDVHVWFVHSREIVDRDRLAAYETLLSADELARYRRFVQARDRHEFLVAHALVRTVLSRYADVPPAAWIFCANEYGRPEIAAPAVQVPLRFNLSHTRGLSACVVAIGRDVGVDVEDLERQPAGEEIAERFFAPPEVDALRLAPRERQSDLFLQYWTLKEAYVKARGAGLSLPLAQFAFDLAPDRPPAVQVDASLGDHGSEWQFLQVRPDPHHVLAVAIRRRHGRDARVRLQHTTPLADS